MEKTNVKTDLDERLDDALADTFPCSDPFSFQTPMNNGRKIPITENAADKSHLSYSIEAHRIELLIDRDGIPAARAWVERTLDIYRKAMSDTHGYARTGHYKPLFEASIRAFEKWLTDSRREQTDDQ
jgi:hypothetical protein